MNDVELLRVLQDTLTSMRRYGLNHAIRGLDMATKGRILSRPSRRSMVRDVLSGLGNGNDNMLYRAMEFLGRPPAIPPKVMCLDSNNALHYVGCSKGSMSSAQPNLQNIPKGTKPVNTEQLRAALAESEAQDAAQAVADQRFADLQRYFRLHAATGAVLTDIRDKAITPRTLTAEFRFELKALAAEFGYRIVLVGDRTQAVLVQQ